MATRKEAELMKKGLEQLLLGFNVTQQDLIFLGRVSSLKNDELVWNIAFTGKNYGFSGRYAFVLLKKPVNREQVASLLADYEFDQPIDMEGDQKQLKVTFPRENKKHWKKHLSSYFIIFRYNPWFPFF